jgi:hypothetical protein
LVELNPMVRALFLATLLSTLAGCDSDCADTSRINGTYAMWHTVLNAGADGGATADEGYPSYQVFINGWSKWKITWSSGSGTVNADITDIAEYQGDFNDGSTTSQSFEGTMAENDDNCNTFTLHLTGDFETTVDTVNSFTYDATMAYMGDHVAGTFTYTDTYTGTAEDGSPTSGGLSGASGDLSGTLQTDGKFDTGFAEE